MDENIRNNINKLVSMIDDGESKFMNSSLLNQSIQVLARGGEPIHIINQLIDIIDEQNIELTKYITLYGANR